MVSRLIVMLLFSCSVVSDSLTPHGLQHARLPYPSPSPAIFLNSCPLRQWAIQPSRPLLAPSLAAFNLSQHQYLFTSSGQSIGASASASGLPMNIQDWFPLGVTGLILLSKGLSRVFSNTTVQKHQFFSVLYESALTTIYDYWKKYNFDYTDLCWQSNVSAF